ncbi:hypothetical protein [Zooshikella ganghwensis]|uniref:Fibronectin type-III domain-containing protein n=1 Tax=Zooshikella ganghwensis TaxID=202772 RepID=A0A4P9VDT6_9GAMM|nr:hypothetical protein [Zooshikella ganghwensis]RDH41235.1 hypothetical protein B9G39_29425 [Zooshikella ganghwensis]
MKKTTITYCLLTSLLGLTSTVQAAISAYSYDENTRLTTAVQDQVSSYDYVYDSMGNQLVKYILPDQSSYTAPELEITYPEELSKPINPDHPTLSWDIGEIATPVVFDLYFGEENPPKLYRKGLTVTELKTEHLKSNTKYYWKVVAIDQHNQVIEETKIVELKTLNTPPNEPVLVAFDKHKNTLSWKLPEQQDPDPNDEIAAYDVYLSEIGQPLQLIAENIADTNIKLTKILNQIRVINGAL